jgi:DNA-binding LacI/PurR family transcriptional regulator
MRSNELDNFGLEIMWGIENALRENNINFMIKKYAQRPKIPDELATLVKDMPIEGIIVDRDFPEELLKAAEIMEHPIVVCGRKSLSPKCGYSAPNFYDYFYQTLSMLANEEWRDVRFMYSKTNIYKEDCLSALNDFNSKSRIKYEALEYTRTLKGWTDSEHLYVYSETEKMIKENKLPEVFFCDSDWTAVRIIEVLQKHNIKVPEDVKIIGSLGLNIAAQSSPPISTLQVDAWELGRKSVEVLIKLHESSSFPALEKVPLKFIERESFKWRAK